MAESDNLTQRAIALRSMAVRLDRALVLTLHLRAGGDVWQGGTAERCVHDLVAMRRSVLAAADELRGAARTLEQRAAALAAAAAAGPTPVVGNR
jgi:hypothetical protein